MKHNIPPTPPYERPDGRWYVNYVDRGQIKVESFRYKEDAERFYQSLIKK